MPDDMYSSQYWDIIYFKVEGKSFCAPRIEFEESSEVFADMFLLPPGPGKSEEGQDKEHPIVLEGYKADEFASLLKVMYPRATSLISGTKAEYHLDKDEWISVVKLSTIWSMHKIREFAIHRLSTYFDLPPLEKIQLARTHKVARWFEEGIESLVDPNSTPLTESEMAILGWKTSAHVLWIQLNAAHGDTNSPDQTPRFRKDSIRCTKCSSSTSLLPGSHNCKQCYRTINAGDELTYVSGTTTTPAAVPFDRIVHYGAIKCAKCKASALSAFGNLTCEACLHTISNGGFVRITLKRKPRELIKDIFQKELKEYRHWSKPSKPSSSFTSGPLFDWEISS